MHDSVNNTDNAERLKRAYLALKQMQDRVVQLQTPEAVAVVGMGCRFPGGADHADALWKLLWDGVDAIGEVPADRWNIDAYYDPNPDAPGKISTRFGGFLSGIDQFDAAFFGISPREAINLDPQQRLMLEVTWEALENAGIAPPTLAGSATGVFAGISGTDYAQMLIERDPAEYDSYMGSGNAHSVAVGRISYILGLKGPSVALDTACSSSLVAFHYACQSLRNRECSMALAEGVNVILTPAVSVNHSRAHMLPTDGRCKTFDASANGFIRSEGCGVLVLKRLSDAIAAGDRILAVVRGSAVNQDGRTSGITVPSGPSQQAVILQALQQAGIKPSEVGYVEAHGTGTALGDPIELGALGEVFSGSRPDNAPLLVGSVKTNIGHLEAAAGVAGLIKAILCLTRKQIPRHLHFQNPNPLVDWSRLHVRVPQENMSWEGIAGRRIAGVSSFGFGGTNAHVVLEGYDDASAKSVLPAGHLQLLTLSAKNEAALKSLALQYAAYLGAADMPAFADICQTANACRAHFEYRLCLLASHAGEAADKLKGFLEDREVEGLFRGQGIPGSGFLRFDKDETGRHDAAVVLERPMEHADAAAWQAFLTLVAEKYIAGCGVDWQGFVGQCSFRKVALPTYPFQRETYWVAPSAGKPERELQAKADCLYKLVWQEQPASPAAVAPQGRETVVVFADRTGVSAALVGKLKEQGHRVVVVRSRAWPSSDTPDCFLVDSDARQDFDALVDAILAVPDMPIRGIWHLWSLDAAEAGHDSTACMLKMLEMIAGTVFHLIQALVARQVAVPEGIRFVTRGAVAAFDGDKPPLAGQSALWGMGRVIALEHPALWGGLADLPCGSCDVAADSECLLGALRSGDGEDYEAFRDGRRYVERLSRLEDRPENTRGNISVQADGTYLVTGGLGALGRRMAAWLVGKGARHIVLTGRSGKQPGHAAFVAALERQGVRVLIVRADVADENAMQKMLDDMQQTMPPLRGVVHAAGVPGFHLLNEMTPACFSQVMRGKVGGAWNLHKCTAGMPLDFFIMFSSISSVWGSRGHGHYAAANRFLDVLAEYRSRNGLPALSISWGPWAGDGMATPAVQDILKMMGVSAMPPDRSLVEMERLLCSVENRVTVADVDWPLFRSLYESKGRSALLERMPSQADRPHTPAPEARSAVAEAIRNANPEERIKLLKSYLQKVVAGILRLDAERVPDVRQGFTEMGMDSLMTLELKNALEQEFGVTLSSTLAFDHPTITQLTRFLDQDLCVSAVSGKVPEDAESTAGKKASASMHNEPIAVIGLGCRFPGGADSPAAFWRLLCSGFNGVVEVPPDRWDLDAYYDPDPHKNGKMYVKSGGFLRDIDQFDPQFFEISGREAVSLDPQQRLLLEVSWEALEYAGQVTDRLVASPTGVFVGITSSDYQRLCMEAGDSNGVDTYDLTGNANNVAAGRLSYAFGFQGPSLVVDTACSSSLVAVHLACQSLRNGECERALAGGVNVILSAEGTVAACRARMLSPDGCCKTFDASADGYGRGEGCGMVVLKRLSDAVKAEDQILAVIQGAAVNHGGPSSGLTVPSGSAQQLLIAAALENAGMRPEQVGYIEAHGTGTSLGDPIELKALGQLFSEGHTAGNPLVVGSVKTNIGHLESASGVAGLIKAILMVQNGRIPPHLHFANPSPHIPWAALPVKVPVACMDWRGTAGLRVAGVSSFGFGGTNAHVVVQNWTGSEKKAAVESGKPNLLTLSAKSEAALLAMAGRIADFLQDSTGIAFADICQTANACRTHFDYRLCLLASSSAEAASKLVAFVRGGVPESFFSGVTKADGSAGTCDLSVGLAGIAQGYVEGAAIDWKVFYAGKSVRPVVLPGYPFQRERYWITAGTSASKRNKPDISESDVSVHPLLGRRLALADTDGIVFENCISRQKPSFLDDHRVFGNVVLPATAYLEMGLAAGYAVMGSLDLTLRNVVFEQAMIIPEDAVCMVQVVLKPSGKNCYDFKVFSCAPGAASGKSAWIFHAGGAVSSDVEKALPVLPSVEQLRTEITREIPAEQFYRAYRERGIAFGPLFQAVEKVWYETDRTLGLVQLDPSLETGDFVMHPILLDGCFQTFGAAFPEATADDAFLPIGLERLTIHGGSIDRLWCQAKIRREESVGIQALAVDLDLVTEDGRVLGQVQGLQLKRASRDALTRSMPAVSDDWLYEIAWQKKHLSGKEGPAELSPDTEDVEPKALPASSAGMKAPVLAGDRGRWLMLADRSGVGKQLARVMTERGMEPVLVYADEYNEKAYQEMLQAALSQGRVEGIVHLGSLDACSADRLTTEELEHAQALGCYSVLNLLQAKAVSVPALYLVTRDALRVTEEDTVTGLAQSPVWGMAKGIALEHPEWRCVRLDLPGGEVPVEALADELMIPDGEDQIALRKGSRYVARMVRKPRLTVVGPASVKADKTYLITGGLKGLGLLTAGWLVENGARHLVLMGRSGADAAAQAAVLDMEKAGVKVHVVKADVASAKDWSALMQAIDSMPPLGGIIHSAGVLDDGLLMQQTDARFARVMAPKVTGAWLLHSHIKDQPLDFVVFFSSTASVLGSPGQANHSAANAFLDSLAAYRKAKGWPCLAINWGAWSEIGVAARHGVADKVRAKGMGTIAPRQGMAVLGRLLATEAVANVAVIPLQWDIFIQQFKSDGVPRFLTNMIAAVRMLPGASKKTEAEDVSGKLVAMSAGDRLVFIEICVREQVAGILRLKAEKLDMDLSLNSMGLDSLMALELRGRIKVVLGVELPVVRFVEGNGIRKLAGLLADHVAERFQEVDGGVPGKAAKPVVPEAAEDVLARIDQLNDEEVDRLLQVELAELEHKA